MGNNRNGLTAPPAVRTDVATVRARYEEKNAHIQKRRGEDRICTAAREDDERGFLEDVAKQRG